MLLLLLLLLLLLFLLLLLLFLLLLLLLRVGACHVSGTVPSVRVANLHMHKTTACERVTTKTWAPMCRNSRVKNGVRI